MVKKAELWRNAACVLVLLLAGILVLQVYSGNRQPQGDMEPPLTFRGEYRLEGGDWAPLTENATLSALQGGLELRGTLGAEIPEDELILLYLEHVDCRVTVNGTPVRVLESREYQEEPDLCGVRWAAMVSPGIGPEDEVVISLQNPHRMGNTDAYRLFLENLYAGAYPDIKDTVQARYQFFQIVGLIFMLAALPLLGIAVAFSIMKQALGHMMWALGLMTLFMGGYTALDSPGAAMWSEWSILYTTVRPLCIMLALYALGLYLVVTLEQRGGRLARWAVTVQGVAVAAVICGCLVMRTTVFSVLPYWFCLQSAVTLVQLGCCLWPLLRREWDKGFYKFTCVCLLLANLADLSNALFSWWTANVTQWAFLVLFAAYLVRSIVRVPTVYSAEARAKRLEEELKNSRAVLAMSQIRAHFVFNVLNAISGMCKYDPEKADETIVMFSRFLRTNIAILQEDYALVDFRDALRHLEDYIALEQVRFEDQVRFEMEIEAEDFRIPGLIIQPIVENAVRHGILPKGTGGTISLRTWEESGRIFLRIRDDGVGFDPTVPVRKNSVGLSNVRFRLEHLVNGSLKIESVPGAGTEVTIEIPRKER